MAGGLDRAERGAAAEELAAAFVAAQGAELVVRNFRCRLGELDLVAMQGRVLIVAEVRTRSSEAYGGAAASIDARKQRRIIRATQRLLLERRELSCFPVRFDVIVVSGIGSAAPRIEWLKHAFEA